MRHIAYVQVNGWDAHYSTGRATLIRQAAKYGRSYWRQTTRITAAAPAQRASHPRADRARAHISGLCSVPTAQCHKNLLMFPRRKSRACTQSFARNAFGAPLSERQPAGIQTPPHLCTQKQRDSPTDLPAGHRNYLDARRPEQAGTRNTSQKNPSLRRRSAHQTHQKELGARFTRRICKRLAMCQCPGP